MNKEFIKKVLAVQTALKAPKNQYNSFGKYNYRSAEDILEAAKPLLAEQGLLLTVFDNIIYLEGRWYVCATAELTDGEDTIQTCAFAREDAELKGMTGAQISGSTSSYARKYSLSGLLLLDDCKDPDTDEQKRQMQATQKQAQQPVQQPAQQQTDYMEPVRKWWPYFVTLFIDKNEALGNLLRNIGAKSMDNLTKDQADRAVAHMSRMYNERQSQQ